MRTGRTNGTNSYEYIYNGSQLMRMVRNGVTVDFTYINGIPATISFNGMTFYYVVNGQGDVTGITDSDGNLQLSYYYDAWGTPYYIYPSGNTYGSTLLTINPIMYRGYVFDRELGMYYLQSRYYIPQISRFLNADAFVSTGQGLVGNNMISYCGNNPVVHYDEKGYFWTVKKTEVMEVSTIVEEEKEDEVMYCTTIEYYTTKSFLFFYTDATRYRANIYYAVTISGEILCDNNQSDIWHLENEKVCTVITSEMRKVARDQVSESLKGRSLRGMSSELYWHYKIYSWGKLEKATEETFMGSPGKVGYDRNAIIWEMAFGDIFTILG